MLKNLQGTEKKCQGDDASRPQNGPEHHKGSSLTRNMQYQGFMEQVLLGFQCDSQLLWHQNRMSVKLIFKNMFFS